MFFEVGMETSTRSEKSHQRSKPPRSGVEGGFESGFWLLVFRQVETSGLVCSSAQSFCVFGESGTMPRVVFSAEVELRLIELWGKYQRKKEEVKL